jgi:8-oxo-dGTP pyrophosphatase MutT (NUDIX family)
MITFDESSVRFTCRIVGIALDRGRVLLQRAEADDFWALPGGRAELLESSPATLIREMQEEIGTVVTVERLVWLAENFFEYDGRAYHEIGFYFLMQLPAESALRATPRFYGHEGSLRIIFEWQPIDTLEQVRLYPSFLRTGLKSMPATTTHIIHTDDKDNDAS